MMADESDRAGTFQATTQQVAEWLHARLGFSAWVVGRRADGQAPVTDVLVTDGVVDPETVSLRAERWFFGHDGSFRSPAGREIVFTPAWRERPPMFRSVGAFMVVPVVLGDSSLFGFLGGLDPTPRRGAPAEAFPALKLAQRVLNEAAARFAVPPRPRWIHTGNVRANGEGGLASNARPRVHEASAPSWGRQKSAK